MKELILAAIVTMIFAMFALTIFPPFHTMISSVDISSMSSNYLLTALVTGMPYFLLFGIIYGIILIITHRNQGQQ